MGSIVKFEDLPIWKEGRELTRKVYSCSRRKPFVSDFPLVDQIRRACISITSNIAEGFDARSNAEFIRFLGYARRSISEVKNQLYVALDENYITHDEFSSLYEHSSTISKMLCGFMQYLKRTHRSRE